MKKKKGKKRLDRVSASPGGLHCSLPPSAKPTTSWSKNLYADTLSTESLPNALRFVCPIRSVPFQAVRLKCSSPELPCAKRQAPCPPSAQNLPREVPKERVAHGDGIARGRGV